MPGNCLFRGLVAVFRMQAGMPDCGRIRDEILPDGERRIGSRLTIKPGAGEPQQWAVFILEVEYECYYAIRIKRSETIF